MAIRDAIFFIIIVFAIAEFIAFVGSMITYLGILNDIKNDPMNTQNMVNFGNWLVEFIKGQVYGWPISLITTSLGYLLYNWRNSHEF